MADNKKYYYLKLKEGFFDSDEMIILESMPDGYLYSNILLKLYLRSLKYQGRLMFNERIPFNSTMLAQVTRHSVGVIEKAMQVLQELGLVEVLDNGAIYMSDIQNFIGKSSTEADRIRTYRNQIEAEKNGSALPCTNVQQMSYKCTPEIELEREIDIERKTDTEKKTKNTPSGEARNTPSGESLPSQPMQSVENSVETVENAETRAERALNQRLNLHAENVIGEFKISYAYFIGKPHGDIPPDKLEGIKRAIIENGLNHRHIAAYFGDNGAGGTKPLYGDSDAKIYHFVSPGVVEILKRRCGE